MPQIRKPRRRTVYGVVHAAKALEADRGCVEKVTTGNRHYFGRDVNVSVFTRCVNRFAGHGAGTEEGVDK